MKIETSPVLYLDKFIALQSKSYASHAYQVGEKEVSKEKAVQPKSTFDMYEATL